MKAERVSPSKPELVEGCFQGVGWIALEVHNYWDAVLLPASFGFFGVEVVAPAQSTGHSCNEGLLWVAAALVEAAKDIDYRYHSSDRQKDIPD